LQKQVETRLARALIAGEVGEGQVVTFKVDEKKGELGMEVGAAKKAEKK
jgi:hypothetical protein